MSKVERCEVAPPSEDTIIRWAHVLGEDPDFVLAKAGKVSTEVQKIIIAHPHLFTGLLRQLQRLPEDSLNQVVREITVSYGAGPE